MAFIELKDINAGYVKGKPILKDFHVAVEKGELVSLLGPSGCGKTTTLRTIAGFIMAEKGSVTIGGKDYTRIPPNKRNIGLVFQNYALFPHLSVYGNVAYGLKRRKVPGEQIAHRIDAVLKLVSLSGFEKRLPSELSGGQRQRVALARSIVIEPDLLLLDEPLSNLDAKLRDEMRAELSRLQNQLGITMIYVTHDQIEALSLSSRIIVMNEGRIEQMGTPGEIYEEPATPFVAKFVGFDNILEARFSGTRNDGLEVDVEGNTFVCARIRESLKSLKNGDNLQLFFRPEDILFVRETAENTIGVSVDYLNYQGNSTLYSLRAGKRHLKALLPGKARPESPFIYISPDKIFVERAQDAAVITDD